MATSAKKPKTFHFHLFIRRVHLYSGLFLLPWVLLYGASAFLFNHPRFFTNTAVETLPQPSGLESFAKPNQLADQILAAVATNKGIEIQDLKRHEEASYPYNVHIRTYGEKLTGRFYFDLDGDATTLERRPGTTKTQPSSLDGHYPLALAKLDDETLRTLIEPMLQDLGSNPYRTQIRWVPDLEFTFSYDNALWQASYDLRKAILKAQKLEDIHGPGWRRTMLDLHKTHVYEGSMARILWVIIVDIMAFAMIIWGLSGAYMWWKMKKTRSMGRIVLMLSFAIAAAMIYAMYTVEFI